MEPQPVFDAPLEPPYAILTPADLAVFGPDETIRASQASNMKSGPSVADIFHAPKAIDKEAAATGTHAIDSWVLDSGSWETISLAPEQSSVKASPKSLLLGRHSSKNAVSSTHSPPRSLAKHHIYLISPLRKATRTSEQVAGMDVVVTHSPVRERAKAAGDVGVLGIKVGGID